MKNKDVFNEGDAMEMLFREVGLHTGLGRTIEQVGEERFWRALIFLLRQLVPCDNALATYYPAEGKPLPLEVLSAPGPKQMAMELYLGGLYELDPFYVACRESIASGFYHLEEIAPDDFRHSEYFLKYFRDNVLEDEVQFMLQLPERNSLTLSRSYLTLSLGRSTRFDERDCGLLAMIEPWVRALMSQHWQHYRLTQESAHQDVISLQVRDALSHFGTGVLSERELEISRLILRGYSSKAMAKRLGISPETVKVHRRHLYTKLDITSQQELFSLFIQSLGHDPEHP